MKSLTCIELHGAWRGFQSKCVVDSRSEKTSAKGVIINHCKDFF